MAVTTNTKQQTKKQTVARGTVTTGATNKKHFTESNTIKDKNKKASYDTTYDDVIINNKSEYGFEDDYDDSPYDDTYGDGGYNYSSYANSMLSSVPQNDPRQFNGVQNYTVDDEIVNFIDDEAKYMDDSSVLLEILNTLADIKLSLDKLVTNGNNQGQNMNESYGNNNMGNGNMPYNGYSQSSNFTPTNMLPEQPQFINTPFADDFSGSLSYGQDLSYAFYPDSNMGYGMNPTPQAYSYMANNNNIDGVITQQGYVQNPNSVNNMARNQQTQGQMQRRMQGQAQGRQANTSVGYDENGNPLYTYTGQVPKYETGQQSGTFPANVAVRNTNQIDMQASVMADDSFGSK